MSEDSDRVLTAIEHYVNQIKYEIEKAHRDKVYLDYDWRWVLHEKLNELSDTLSDYDPDVSLKV